MAMHVALLNQENEAILKELESLSRMVAEEHEKKEEGNNDSGETKACGEKETLVCG